MFIWPCRLLQGVYLLCTHIMVIISRDVYMGKWRPMANKTSCKTLDECNLERCTKVRFELNSSSRAPTYSCTSSPSISWPPDQLFSPITPIMVSQAQTTYQGPFWVVLGGPKQARGVHLYQWYVSAISQPSQLLTCFSCSHQPRKHSDRRFRQARSHRCDLQDEGRRGQGQQAQQEDLQPL